MIEKKLPATDAGSAQWNRMISRRKFIASAAVGAVVLVETSFYGATLYQKTRTKKDHLGRIKVLSVEDMSSDIKCEGIDKLKRVRVMTRGGKEAVLHFVGVQHRVEFAEKHAEKVSELLACTGATAFCTELPVGESLPIEEKIGVLRGRLTGIFGRKDMTGNEKLKLLRDCLNAPDSKIGYFEYVAQHALITRRPTIAVIEGWNEKPDLNTVAEIGADAAILSGATYGLASAVKGMLKLAAAVSGKEPEKKVWKEATFVLSFLFGHLAGAVLGIVDAFQQRVGWSLIPGTVQDTADVNWSDSPITVQRERYAASAVRAMLEQGHEKLLFFGGSGHTDALIGRLSSNEIPASSCFYDRVIIVHPEGMIDSLPLA